MKFTIIIPIYNSASKLKRCLDSILDQEFSDYECILVDDGSTDDSFAICKVYASDDSRFIAIHKENDGVGAARNTGIDNAKGEWIVFVDSDDCLSKDHLVSINEAIKTNSDLIVCGFKSIYPDKETIHTYQDKFYSDKSEIVSLFQYTDFLQNQTPWDKAYRRDIIFTNNIKFDTKLPISEDRLFVYEYLIHVSSVRTLSTVTYIHDETDYNSLSHKYHSFEILDLRYKKLSTAMYCIIDQFHIEGNAIVPFWKYNWMLMTSALHQIYDVRRFPIGAIRRQNMYFKQNFDWQLYDVVKDFPEIRRFMSSTINTEIITCRFGLIACKRFVNFILLKLHTK